MTKSFVFKNTGAMAVTAGSSLKLVGGDSNGSFVCSELQKAAQPGQHFALHCSYLADQQPGNYLFELQTTFGQYAFGEKVHIDISVEEN